MATADQDTSLRTLIVDDEPLAVERLQVVCAKMEGINVAGTANDGAAALRLIEALEPDLVLLDMTMPVMDGLTVAKKLAEQKRRPAVIFVTAHDSYAVEAFDLDAVDYVLKPVTAERLSRAIDRAQARKGTRLSSDSRWLEELWIPHKSELIRIEMNNVSRIDAERDYVRLHVGEQTYLLLQTIAGLEEKLDPSRFIRIHRSNILRRDFIRGLRHDGLGVWLAELENGAELRIGRTYLPKVKAMAGR
ncbi:LytR/AlgR family response regulator transcription factor [Altererythrobacter sp. MF3-039]|uniref:LytR/AlgR family response regulator transcription factor n=1 Tax=Altererythrobacter sp. MF3-039 TaxID=3252901 RepID=UPI00390CC6BE